MFEELEQKESTDELNDKYLLQLREIFNLPIPEMLFLDVVNDDEEDVLVEDFCDIENFKIEEDSLHEEILCYDQLEESVETMETSAIEIMEKESESTRFSEDNDYFFDMVEDSQEEKEPDEISKHFQ